MFGTAGSWGRLRSETKSGRTGSGRAKKLGDLRHVGYSSDLLASWVALLAV